MHRSALGLLACLPACVPSAVRMRQWGTMREVMRDGHTEPRVALLDVVRAPHAFAVGALEGLEGEVTIADSAAWVTRASEHGVETSGPEVHPADDATLLTLAWVEGWTEVPLASGAELEAAIAAHTRAVGQASPVPFVVEGPLAHLELHVVRGHCPHAGDPAHVPWRLALDGVPRATLVGFWAEGAAGVLTHHGTTVHAHVLLEHHGQRVTGHVDAVELGAGTVLRLPR